MCKSKKLPCILVYTSFTLIWYATWPLSEKKRNLTLWPHPRGRGCVYGQHICFHCDLCSIPFNLICNMTTFRKKNDLTFWTHPRGQGCVCAENIYYHVAACIVSFNLICNMTIFWKSLILASAPPHQSTPGDWTQAFKLNSCLVCFISIAPLPAYKISAKNIDNCFAIAKFKYLTFDPLGGGGGGKILTLPCLSTGTGQSWSIVRSC